MGGDAGMALLTVLWFVALMSALAVTLIDLGRDSAYATRNAVKAIESRAAVGSAVAIAAQTLKNARFPDDGVLRWRQDRVAITVKATPEGGKIDLNAAGDDLIEALARIVAGDADAGLALGHAILDWRDPGSERRLAGAEADDYAATGRLARPRDDLFRFPGELRSVLGVDAETYARLAANVTVAHGQPDPPAAMHPPLARAAIDGLMEAEADAAGVENAFDVAEQSLDEAGDDAEPVVFSTDPDGLYTLDIELAYDDGPQFRQQTVIWTDPPTEFGRYAVLQSRSVVLPTANSAPAGEVQGDMAPSTPAAGEPSWLSR